MRLVLEQRPIDEDVLDDREKTLRKIRLIAYPCKGVQRV